VQRLQNYTTPRLCGGDGGTQTPDPLVANQTLYQLSYIPVVEVRVGFEPTVELLCRQLPWTTRPPHYTQSVNSSKHIFGALYKYCMFKYSCPHCTKEFVSALGLAGHKRMHGPSGGKIDSPSCCCLITKRELLVRDLEKHQRSLKSCKNCQTLFKPGMAKIFCSHSCSASYTNRLRGPRSEVTKKRISESLTRKPPREIKPSNSNNKIAKLPRIKKDKNTIIGPFSQVFICACKHCKIKFASRNKKQYCTEHRDLYSASNKFGYKFTFNVFHYPDLFDIDLLKSVGWFSPGGKAGKWNPNGLSRDHRISVNDAVTNRYDSYHITHPLNCELMPHVKNNKKKTKSSITYEELKSLVDEYDRKRQSNLLPRTDLNG